MAINFPDSPTNGDTFVSGTRTWTYNGSSWVLAANPPVTIAPTSIVNADISATAAIAKTKIAGTAITAADTGTVTSTMIADGTIVNADVSSTAAIALSKLASGSSAQVVIGNASGVPSYQTVSGDLTLTNAGVATIANASVTNAKLVNSSITIGSTSVALGSSATSITGLTNLALTGQLTLGSVRELVGATAVAATGTVNIDFLQNPTLYYTSNSTGNFVLNVRGNSTNTLNSVMNVGDIVTVTFLATNGSPAYYATSVTVDGAAATVRWQGGTAPSSGNTSSIDSYSLSVFKSANATFTVFAGLVKFA